ncbi:MAG: hypothetical protein ABIR15_01420 [Chitinophagaceae bacterium]
MKPTKASFFMSFIFVIILGQPVFSQTLKEFFGTDATTAQYLGIDFTKTKLIDDASSDEKDIVARQYAGINELAATDSKKLSLAGAFHKSIMDHDLGPVNKRNLKIDPSQIKSTNTSDFHRLKEDDINTLVKGFDYDGKKGLGILFVMEAMSKTGKAAAIWVTFIDMGTKKMLFTERMEEKVGMGFGFKNYWAIPVKRLLDDIKDDKFKEWKAKYQ